MRKVNQDPKRDKFARFPGLAGLALLLAGFVLLAVPARAETIKFEAMLDQDQALPAPTAVAEAGGRAYITLETDGNVVAWVIEYYSLSGEIVAIHIHGPAGHGETGDVSVTIDNTSETVGELTGSATVSPEQVQQLMDGLWYVNVHTELNGPGEIRGQLIQQ